MTEIVIQWAGAVGGGRQPLDAVPACGSPVFFDSGEPLLDEPPVVSSSVTSAVTSAVTGAATSPVTGGVTGGVTGVVTGVVTGLRQTTAVARMPMDRDYLRGGSET
ncbi:hypothetical protein [Microbispora hainanensis]|uniref:hypothetical protein n=1 Tax=Microbispora hainanensis TaxID=568844 RepID=UPI00324E625B